MDDRKYLVIRFFLQKKSVKEISTALTELDCVNPNTNEPWTDDLIRKDIAEFKATFKEKSLTELMELKLQKYNELDEIVRICFEKNDNKNAIAAIKLQIELFGLQAPLRSEVSFKTNATDEIMNKLDSYFNKNDRTE